MTDADDDAFVDALRGRRAPSNLDTRRAARLARYFHDHPRGEQRVHHDPVGEAQLLAYLRAQPQAPAAAPAAPGLLDRLKDWLLPAQGLGLRHAGGALAILGVAVVVFQLMPHGTGDDDPSTMKGLPPAIVPAPPDGGAASAAQILAVADPEHAARDLQAQLAARGVVATVSASGADWVLVADTASGGPAALAAAAAEQGLALNRKGQLEVRFRRVVP